MEPIDEQNKKERLSLFIDSELYSKVKCISNKFSLPVSQIVQKALQNYIDQIEKEKIETELEVGYKSNYEYYLKEQADWKYADKE